MAKHLTVVYTIHDDGAFAPKLQEIMGQLQPSDGLPFAVTAVSRDHEMQRVHWMEQANQTVDDHFALKEVIDTIAGHPDIGNVTSLDELQNS